MCLIVIAWHAHRDFPLIVAANRDEFFQRPTESAHWWQDAPGLLAGRDTLRGGTWLGVTKQGRVAMVTNYREPPTGPRAPESRGALVGDYLRGDMPAADYLHDITTRRANFDGFNLIAGDRGELWFLGKREPGPRALGAGIHGMSNGDLDAPWPKVLKGNLVMRHLLVSVEGSPPPERGRPREGVEALSNELFSMLADRTPAAGADLPDTGVGRELEQKLSPIFVRMDGYGTRSSTVVVINRNGDVHFQERSFGDDGRPSGDATYEFRL